MCSLIAFTEAWTDGSKKAATSSLCHRSRSSVQAKSGRRVNVNSPSQFKLACANAIWNIFVHRGAEDDQARIVLRAEDLLCRLIELLRDLLQTTICSVHGVLQLVYRDVNTEIKGIANSENAYSLRRRVHAV